MINANIILLYYFYFVILLLNTLRQAQCDKRLQKCQSELVEDNLFTKTTYDKLLHSSFIDTY